MSAKMILESFCVSGVFRMFLHPYNNYKVCRFIIIEISLSL